MSSSAGLVDLDWVEKYTHGYDELKARVLAEYPVERCAKLTGVPAEVIRSFAREYAAAEGQVIRLGVALERSRNGGQAIRAITSLSGLVGAWRHPGGGMLEMPLWEFPELCPYMSARLYPPRHAGDQPDTDWRGIDQPAARSAAEIADGLQRQSDVAGA